jgi:DNA primase
MASDTVQKVKDRLSIVDVVSGYLKLERSGTALRARCPFHSEKTPSFFVSPERGTFHCFGCGEGGDIFTFVEKIEGLDFKGALKVLAEKAGVEIVYEAGGKEKKDERDRLFELLETATIFYASRLDDSAKKYLHDRGIEGATIQLFRLGLAGDGWDDLVAHLKAKKFTDKEMLESGMAKKNERGGLTDKFRNRIMFPIGDPAGRVVGFSGRIFGPKASPEAPKYLNSPETPLFHKSRILYGFDKAKLSMHKLQCAVLVEGQMDLLASYQAGWGNTLAVSGTAFTPEHAALIRRMTDNLVIALDADAAGIKAAGKAARAALQGGLNVKVARLPDGLDPADLVLKEGPDAWKAAIRESKDIIAFLLDVLQEHAKSPDNFRRSVETVVLPFLSDVRSPIARESYVREIASRLSVSEHAVLESLHAVPKVAEPKAEEKVPPATKGEDRSRAAFALLLWQQSLEQPTLDLAAYEKQLIGVLGEAAYQALARLPQSEQEALRFRAERLYGASLNLQREAQGVLDALAKDSLSRELSALSGELQKAEKEGNEAEKERLTKAVDMLIRRIAQLHALR